MAKAAIILCDGRAGSDAAPAKDSQCAPDRCGLVRGLRFHMALEMDHRILGRTNLRYRKRRIIVARMMRRKNIDWQRVFLIAWPALIPPLWFEVLSSHSQIHASFVSRSAAASAGVLLAALLIQAKATPFELVHQLKRAFTRKVRGPAVEIPPLK